MVSLARRNLFHDRLRFVITVAGVAFAVTLVLVQVGLFLGLLDKATVTIRNANADLWVTSTARDTDFIVRVSDVYPDGRSILLMDYVRRARYRQGYEREVLLEPGHPTQVAFDVGWISQIFATGHRIRITVASTGAPFYEPNPNTGEPLTSGPPPRVIVATNAVLHSPTHASRIIAPWPSK